MYECMYVCMCRIFTSLLPGISKLQQAHFAGGQCGGLDLQYRVCVAAHDGTAHRVSAERQGLVDALAASRQKTARIAVYVQLLESSFSG